jgi:hypothetical protein
MDMFMLETTVPTGKYASIRYELITPEENNREIGVEPDLPMKPGVLVELMSENE